MKLRGMVRRLMVGAVVVALASVGLFQRAGAVAEAGPSGLANLAGTHFLYLDTSTYQASDVLDVYKVTSAGPALIQALPIDAVTGDEYYIGTNTLALVRASDGTQCLAVVDTGNQDIETYSLDPRTGLVERLGGSTYVPTGVPEDVQASGAGQFIAVTTRSSDSTTSGVQVYSVGHYCSITLVVCPDRLAERVEQE